MNRAEAIDRFGIANEMGHVTNYSDSSLYDEKCVLCGATDRGGFSIYDNRCPVEPVPYETIQDKITRLENELEAAGRNVYELQLWTKKEVNRIVRQGYDKAMDHAINLAENYQPSDFDENVNGIARHHLIAEMLKEMKDDPVAHL